jgi:hypothetical protein
MRKFIKYILYSLISFFPGNKVIPKIIPILNGVPMLGFKFFGGYQMTFEIRISQHCLSFIFLNKLLWSLLQFVPDVELNANDLADNVTTIAGSK